MKKFKLFTLGLITLCALTTVSCGDDDDNDSSMVVNEFSFQGTNFSLNEGFIEDLGLNDNGSTYDFDIFLLGDGFTLDSNSGDILGTGDGVILDLNSDDMDGLSDGTYQFSMDRDAFTIVDGGAFIDFDIDNGTGTLVQAVAGNVILSKSGSNYDIEFNLLDSTGNVLMGTYNGTLTTLE